MFDFVGGKFRRKRASRVVLIGDDIYLQLEISPKSTDCDNSKYSLPCLLFRYSFLQNAHETRNNLQLLFIYP